MINMYKIMAIIFCILHFIFGIIAGATAFATFSLLTTLMIWVAGLLSSSLLYAIGEIVDRITYISHKDNTNYFSIVEKQNRAIIKALCDINNTINTITAQDDIDEKNGGNGKHKEANKKYEIKHEIFEIPGYCWKCNCSAINVIEDDFCQKCGELKQH